MFEIKKSADVRSFIWEFFFDSKKSVNDNIAKITVPIYGSVVIEDNKNHICSIYFKIYDLEFSIMNNIISDDIIESNTIPNPEKLYDNYVSILFTYKNFVPFVTNLV